MSPGTIALIIVALSIGGWALFMANVTIRKHREGTAAAGGEPKDESAKPARPARPRRSPKPAAAGAGGGNVTVETVPPAARKPLTPDELAVSRRQFLNRAWSLSFVGFLGLFGMSSLSFLWPKLTGGFGTKINAGNYDDIMAQIGPANGFKPLFVADGRFWLTYYDGTGDSPVYAAISAVEYKVQALYRKCVHLGCSVPHCETSMLFECPCHGSKYRLHGEFYGGPAPRGLDRFPVAVEGGALIVDTGKVEVGPPRGTNTWDKFAEQAGALCVPQ